MAEERLDVVVDSSRAKRGIDVLVSAMSNLRGMSARAEAATTTLFNKMNSGLSLLESKVFNLKSLFLSFTAVIGVFRQIGNEITKFQAFTSAMAVTVGGAREARVEYNFLMEMSDRLGVSITSLSHNYAQLTAAAAHSGMAVKDVRTIFESFSVAARVMHLSGMDTRLMFYALTQMVSKGVVSMEELRRQLGEKLPGAMNIAAKSLSVDMPTLEAAIRKGAVDSAKFLPIFAEAVKDTFSPGLANAMRAFDAEVNRMINNLQKMVLVFFDLGVADSFTAVIKELNRILSDRGIAEAFADVLKKIADNAAAFLRTIDANSVGSMVNSFSTAMKNIADTVTNHVLPVIQSLLAHVKEIVVSWAAIKGMSLGGQMGGRFGWKGSAAGALIGGAVAGFGANALLNSLTEPPPPAGIPERDWRAMLASHKKNPAQDLGFDPMDLVAPVKRPGKLSDVLNSGGNSNKKFDEAMARLQSDSLKSQIGDNIFINTQLEIQAGKYGQLTQAQERLLLKTAALAESEKQLAEMRKENSPEKYAEAVNKMTEQRENEIVQNYTQLQQSFMTEEQLLDQKFQRELEITNQAYEIGLIQKDQYMSMLFSIEARYEAEMEELRRKKMTEAQKIAAMGWRAVGATVMGEIARMTSGVAQHSRAMFELNKLAALAHAAITLPETIMSAYNWGTKFGGPVLGAAFAAIAGAAQLTQISAIRKASFNGGGAGSAPSIAGSTAAPPSTPITDGLPEPVFGSRGNDIQRQYSVEIRGSALHRPILEEIAMGLSELTKDGFPVIFTAKTADMV